MGLQASFPKMHSELAVVFEHRKVKVVTASKMFHRLPNSEKTDSLGTSALLLSV